MIIPVRSKFVCWRSENGSIPFPETGQRNLLHVQRRQRIEGKREGNEETKEKKKIKRCAVVVSRSLDENDIILSIRTGQHQQQKHFCTLAATALQGGSGRRKTRVNKREIETKGYRTRERERESELKKKQKMRRDERILDLSFIEQSQRQLGIPLSYTPPYGYTANPHHRRSQLLPTHPAHPRGSPTSRTAAWMSSLNCHGATDPSPGPSASGHGHCPRRESAARGRRTLLFSLFLHLSFDLLSTPFRLFHRWFMRMRAPA